MTLLLTLTKNNLALLVIKSNTCRTMGQFLLRDTGHPLEVIMAGIAKVRGAKAEEYSHRAAVPAFILQEICSMLRAHLVMGKTNHRLPLIGKTINKDFLNVFPMQSKYTQITFHLKKYSSDFHESNNIPRCDTFAFTLKVIKYQYLKCHR